MSALTTNRDTPKKQSAALLGSPVRAAVTIFTGALVVLGAGASLAGEYAQPGSTATGLYALGRAVRKVDNSAGADGDTTVDVEPGCFRWANGDAIGVGDIGKPAYVVDDQTVSKGGTGKSLAGVIVDVDANGVWVWTSPDVVALAAAALAAAALAVPMASVQLVAPVALVAGDVAIATGVVITAASVIVPIRVTPDATAAHWGNLSITTTVVGGAGVGGFHIHSANAADTSTVAALILG